MQPQERRGPEPGWEWELRDEQGFLGFGAAGEEPRQPPMGTTHPTGSSAFQRQQISRSIPGDASPWKKKWDLPDVQHLRFFGKRLCPELLHQSKLQNKITEKITKTQRKLPLEKDRLLTDTSEPGIYGSINSSRMAEPAQPSMASIHLCSRQIPLPHFINFGRGNLRRATLAFRHFPCTSARNRSTGKGWEAAGQGKMS